MRATRAGGSLAGTFSWLEGEACAGRHHDGRANSSDTNTTNRQPRSLWDLILCCITIRACRPITTAVGFSRTSLEHLSHSDASDCRHLQQFIVRMKSASEKARNAGYAPGQRSLYDSSSRGTAPIASSSQDQRRSRRIGDRLLLLEHFPVVPLKGATTGGTSFSTLSRIRKPGAAFLRE